MSYNNLKRPNTSNDVYQIPFYKDLNKYCKELTSQNLADPDNTWLDRICAEKQVLEDQIPFVLLSLQAKPDFFGRLLEICKNLELIVKDYFADFPVEIRPFGSTATNLAFKDSDLDLLIDFNDNHPEPTDELASTLQILISKNYKLFRRVQLIRATVPIVKCEHQSGIRCDISFLNALGVLNSELISFLLSIDERLRPFLMILKFWLKKQDLNGSAAITSYALTLMAIFYLQQLEKPVLPPIQYLQQKSTEPRQIAGGWDCSFVKDFTVLPSTENRHSILGLLKGFFQYYSVFEFGIYVISPFAGQKFLKTIFYDDDALPGEIFPTYAENLKKKIRFDQVRFMCVQDPFNHSHNVTRNVPKKVLVNFQEFCARAYGICEEEVNNRKLKKSERCDFFKHLFAPVGDFSSRKKNRKGLEILMCRDLVLQPSGMNYDEDVLRNLWADSVLNYFYLVLTRVMKCEVEIFRGPFALDNCTDDYVTLRKFKCTMPYHLLQVKRRQSARQEFDFPKEMSVLDKEEMISDYICDEHMKNEERLNLKFEIFCYLKKGPSKVLFDLETREDAPSRKNILNETWFLMETGVGKWIAKQFENCTNPL